MFGMIEKTFGLVVKHSEDAGRWGAQFLRECGCKILDLREGDIVDANDSKVDEYYLIIAKGAKKVFDRIATQNDYSVQQFEGMDVLY